MTVIDWVIMKGRHIILEVLKVQALDQLHINHMGIEKTKFLVHESVYWVNINDDTENFMKKLYHMSYISADATKWQDSTS